MARTHSLEHLMRQRLATLSRWLPAARNGHVRSLHQARVATRRLREALPLVASKPRRRRLERVVRQIRRALGPVRELDVALQMLDDLRASKQAPTTAISELKRVILDERGRLHAEMLRRLERCDIPKLRKRALAAGRQPARRGRVRDARQLAAARARGAPRGPSANRN